MLLEPNQQNNSDTIIQSYVKDCKDASRVRHSRSFKECRTDMKVVQPYAPLKI